MLPLKKAIVELTDVLRGRRWRSGRVKVRHTEFNLRRDDLREHRDVDAQDPAPENGDEEGQRAENLIEWTTTETSPRSENGSMSSNESVHFTVNVERHVGAKKAKDANDGKGRKRPLADSSDECESLPDNPRPSTSAGHRQNSCRSRSVSLIDHVTRMPAFNPIVSVKRLSNALVQRFTVGEQHREDDESDGQVDGQDGDDPLPLDCSCAGCTPTNAYSDENEPESMDLANRSWGSSRLSSIHLLDTSSDDGDMLPDPPRTRQATQRMAEDAASPPRQQPSSVHNASPSDGHKTVDASEESEDLLADQAHEHAGSDSLLTASATTEFDSGRSNDSGASVARRLDGYLNEFDNRVPNSSEPLHGRSCVCLKCLRILNVDGNDSPPLTTSTDTNDKHGEHGSQAQDKAQVEAAAKGDSQVDIATQMPARDEADVVTQMPSRQDGLEQEPLPGPSRATVWDNINIKNQQQSEKSNFPPCKPCRRSKSLGYGPGPISDQSIQGLKENLHNFLSSVDGILEGEAQDQAHAPSSNEPNSGDDDYLSSTDDEVRQDERAPRVRRSWDSDSETTSSCDSTDYSDEDDLRNFFVNGGRDDLERAKTDAILGPEPRSSDIEHSFVVEDSDENDDDPYSRQLRDCFRPLIWADRGPAEELPQNLEEILHFPNDDIIGEDPQACFERMLHLGAKHHIPHVFLNLVWTLCQKIYLHFTGTAPKGYFWLRKKVLDDLPQTTLHYTLQHRRTGTIHYVKGNRFRRKRFPSRKYKPLFSETRGKLRELIKYHAQLHQGIRGHKLEEAIREKHEIPLSFYVDGVSPSTTGSMKMVCEVVKHRCCNLILNYNTVIYDKDYQLTADDLLQGLLKDLSRNPNFKVELVVADMPERFRLCGLTHYNGAHGCLSCFSKGENRTGAPGVVWPASTMGEPLRDDESFHNLAEQTRQLGVVVGGQKALSPLLKINNFSIVNSVAIEPMHLFAGLSKYFWERISKQFLSRKQITELTEDLSRQYLDLCFPSDFKRERRAIDPAKWRCNEWKQFVALLGLEIGDAYDKLGFRDVGVFWQRYTWIMRMLAQGDVWYNHGSRQGQYVRIQISNLYKDAEKLLGKNQCTPNLHALYHLPDWRDRHPLGVISAERAESFYGVNRRSFAEQSASIGKQIHVNTLLAAKLGHACETRFKFKAKLKDTDMDHLMVDNTRGVHYYVGELSDTNYYRVRKVNCMPYNGIGGLLNWRDVGVMRFVNVDIEETSIEKTKIIARAIKTKTDVLHIWTRDLHDF